MAYSECSEPKCGNPVFARGFCRKHYDQNVKKEAKHCSINNCTRKAHRRGMCDYHYRKQLKKEKPECKVSGCTDGVKAHGYCERHYQRFWKTGSVEQTRPNDWGAREAHPLYKSYTWHKRGMPKSMDKVWADDFWRFVADVGERPANHTLRKEDPNKPIGPSNFYWKEKATTNLKKSEYAKAWRDNNPDKERNNYLKKKYGITLEQYEAMEHTQNHVCKICEKPQTGRYQNLAVDHCHTSGKVRGLLCDYCNRGIGMLKDDPKTIEAALKYLTQN